mgnify:FL=1
MVAMEQKVGQARGLTIRQKQFLDLACQELYIRTHFYLSGGTALSSWYLHHRDSFDLDIFTCEPFDSEQIKHWIKANQEAIGYKFVSISEDFGFFMVMFRYPDDTFLKVDFHRYTDRRLRKGIVWRGLEIDSLYDIAVNKLETVSSAARGRDYVDLYCILKRHRFTLKELTRGVEKKFSEPLDPLQMIKNFLKVVEYTDLPTMLIPFERVRMDEFYIDLARSLKQDVFI